MEANTIYVDDQSSIQHATPICAVFDKKKKRILNKEEQIKIDENLEADRRTANLMTEIANTIDASIVIYGSFSPK